VFLVTAVGESDFVKLLDFGIGKRLLAGGRRITDRQQLLGTPHYMAPEQARGEHEHIDARSDQFALGVIAYEMLSGAAPFMADNVVALLGKILDEDPPPLLDLAPEGTPKELQAVVERALAKEADRRYADVATFAAAFARAAGYDPTPVPSSSRRTPVKQSADGETTHDLIELLERARQEHRRGSNVAAARFAEQALALAQNVDDPDAERLVGLATPLMRRIMTTRLGGMQQRLRLSRPLSSDDPLPSAKAAYAASRLDGELTLAEFLDVSGLEPVDALRLLVMLLEAGVLEGVVRQPRARSATRGLNRV
jgi:serine/threonine protein kinase